VVFAVVLRASVLPVLVRETLSGATGRPQP
jgi:hypothetical protein